MCLQNIDKELKYKDGKGWKVFRVEGKKLYPCSMDGRKTPWREGVYYKSRRGFITDDTYGSPTLGQRYPMGFHVIPTKNEAIIYTKTMNTCPDIRFVMRRVEYKGASTSGETTLWFLGGEVYRGPCAVAREMKILPRN